MDGPDPGAGRRLTGQEISDAVGGLGWRYVLGLLRGDLRVGSLAEAADLAARVVAAAGADAEGRMWMDLRRDRVVLSLQSPASASVTARELELARRVTEAGAELGPAPHARGGG